MSEIVTATHPVSRVYTRSPSETPPNGTSRVAQDIDPGRPDPLEAGDMSLREGLQALRKHLMSDDAGAKRATRSTDRKNPPHASRTAGQAGAHSKAKSSFGPDGFSDQNVQRTIPRDPLMYGLKSGFQVLSPFTRNSAPPTEIALESERRGGRMTSSPISGKAGDWIVFQFQEDNVLRRSTLIATSAEGRFDMNLQMDPHKSSCEVNPLPSRVIRPGDKTGPLGHAMERRIVLDPFSMKNGNAFVVVVATSDFRDLVVQIKPRAKGRNPAVGNGKDAAPRASS